MAVEGVGGVRRVGAGLGGEDGHIQGRHCKQEVFRNDHKLIPNWMPCCCFSELYVLIYEASFESVEL